MSLNVENLLNDCKETQQKYLFQLRPKFLSKKLEDFQKKRGKSTDYKLYTPTKINEDDEYESQIEEKEEEKFNIFDQKLYETNNFKYHHDQLRFDKNGKVLNYLILGNRDQFMAQHFKQLEKQSNYILRRVSTKIIKQNSFIQQSTGVAGIRPNSSQKLKFSRASQKLETRISQKTDILDNQNEKIMNEIKRIKVNRQTKPELLQKLNQIQSKCEMNQKQYRRKIKSMDFESQIELTKEDRCLQKYDAQHQKWAKEAIILAKQTKKDVNETLIARSNVFRIKRELQDTIEILDYDETLKRQREFWEGSLRKFKRTQSQSTPQLQQFDEPIVQKQIQKDHLFSSNNFYEKKNVSLNNQVFPEIKIKQRHLQIVRHPSILTQDSTNFSKSNQFNISLTNGINFNELSILSKSNCFQTLYQQNNKKQDVSFQDYLMEKLNSNSQKLFNCKAPIRQNDFDSLKITGNNLIKIERESLLNDNKQKGFLYDEVIDDQLIDFQPVNEIIAQNYTKKSSLQNLNF